MKPNSFRCLLVSLASWLVECWICCLWTHQAEKKLPGSSSHTRAEHLSRVNQQLQVKPLAKEQLKYLRSKKKKKTPYITLPFWNPWFICSSSNFTDWKESSISGADQRNECAYSHTGCPGGDWCPAWFPAGSPCSWSGPLSGQTHMQHLSRTDSPFGVSMGTSVDGKAGNILLWVILWMLELHVWIRLWKSFAPLNDISTEICTLEMKLWTETATAVSRLITTSTVATDRIVYKG